MYQQDSNDTLTTTLIIVSLLYLPTLEFVPAIVGIDHGIVLGIHDLADRAGEIILLRDSDVEDFHGGDHNYLSIGRCGK